MRTKHLFYTLALSAAFAACSQEEIVSQQEVASADLSNRPVAGKVVLDFGLESRGTIAEDGEYNSIEFVKGEDGFGARIIDTYAPDANYATYGDRPYRNYQPTTYASSNYKYVNNGGNAWETDALMVEGSYLFYYPYNQANLARTANTVYLPMKQTVSAELPNQPIKDLYEGENPAIVGYAFLKAEGQETTVRPTLNHIFSYPQFTFVNEFTERERVNGRYQNVAKEVTITKVLVNYDGGFAKKGIINHENFINSLRDFELAQVKKTNGAEVYAKVEKGNWAKGKSSVLKSAATDNFVDWTTSGTNAKGAIEVEFDGGLTLQPEEAFSFNLVMPAGVYDDTKLTFTVYLDNDKMFTTDFKVDENNYETLKFAPGYRYPAEEYNKLNTNPVVKPSAGTLGTITLTGDLKDAVAPAAIIDNAEEFEAFLNSVADNSAWVREVASLEAVEDVENGWAFVLADTDEDGVADMQITAEVMELVKTYLSKGGVIFSSTMEVAEAAETRAADAIALDQMIFDQVEILSGNVTVADVNAEKVIVHDGTLTIPSDFSNNLGEIEVKGGELIVKKDGFINKDNAHIVTITNTIVNGVEVAAGKLTIDAEVKDNNFNGLTMNAGEVVIAEDAVVNIGQSANENITAGKITVDGTLEVWSAYVVAEDVEIELNGKVDLTKHTGAQIINEGYILNNISLTATNRFGGVIEMGNIAAYLNASGIEGVVNNTVLAEVDVTGSQTVYAEMDSYEDTKVSNFDTSSSINKVVVTGLWNVDDKASAGLMAVNTIEFNGGGLYVNAGITFDISNANIVIASNTVWGGRSTATIKINEPTGMFTYKTLADGNKATLKVNTVQLETQVTINATTIDGLTVNLSDQALSSLVSKNEGGKEVVKSMSIYSAQDMMSMLALIKAGKIKASEGNGATIKLEANIDMAGKEWTPLSLMHSTFDGKNHVISNLTIVGDRQAGLFSYAGNTHIKNLTIRNANVTAAQAGVFAGNADGATLTNCKLEGTVVVSWKKSNVETYNGVGALIGVVSGGTCNADVDVDAKISINRTGITYENGKADETTTEYVGVVYGGTYNLI